ncbi:HD domain-containing protein [Hydrogenispora ethanolica]|uniref:HD domain-containing protein n=1 Tax=Hydrogenispora ethanolica TaxID=1082276 RepID=A0A4V2QFL7_HYDET|nr:HD domain-containing phosphohydrolase [Hydrogenispora ethanolica]TCL72427.1 HD domain-containing protein [Hydrogenispora ethanolica]
MIKELKVPLGDLIFCLSDAIDLISPSIANHHKRVAYIALNLALEMNLPAEERKQLVIASLLHDCGSLSLKDRLEALEFEFQKPHIHAVLGYHLLLQFPPLAPIAPLVLYHHLNWTEYSNSPHREAIPWLSQLLYLADRLDTLIIQQPGGESLPVKGITARIREYRGKMFAPPLVEAFEALAAKEYFWLDLFSPSLQAILAAEAGISAVELDLERLLALTKLFAQLVDFRNHFTATHSSGVAVCAEKIGQLCGFSNRESQMLRVAGYFHDLGKIVVPESILNKPGRLTTSEFSVIKTHPYYTYRLLYPLTDLATINSWAAFHHERLDGKGYPFHHPAGDLSLGSRIVAVADFFTALSEDRPYRPGLSREKLAQLLTERVQDGALDPHLVQLVLEQLNELNPIRQRAQADAGREYDHFMRNACFDSSRFPLPLDLHADESRFVRPFHEIV